METLEPSEPRARAPGPIVGRGARADIHAWGPDRVLKLFWEGTHPAGAEREAAATRTAREAGLPVPACFGTIAVQGRPGIVFERIPGPSMGQRLLARPWEARRMAGLLAELHAVVNACPAPEEWPSVKERLRRGLDKAAGLPDCVRAAALEALAGLPDGDRICHGDFHPWNIILGPAGPVIIDWADARRGLPALDVARTTVLLRGAPRHVPGRSARLLAAGVLGGVHSRYLRRYLRVSGLDAAEIAAWVPVVAAARLSEGLTVEEDLLLKTAARLLWS